MESPESATGQTRNLEAIRKEYGELVRRLLAWRETSEVHIEDEDYRTRGEIPAEKDYNRFRANWVNEDGLITNEQSRKEIEEVLGELTTEVRAWLDEKQRTSVEEIKSAPEGEKKLVAGQIPLTPHIVEEASILLKFVEPFVREVES